MSSLTSFGLSMRACHVAGMEWNWRSAQSNLSQDILEVKKEQRQKKLIKYLHQLKTWSIILVSLSIFIFNILY